MQPQLFTFRDSHDLYYQLAHQFKLSAEATQPTNVALSGGNTQREFFTYFVQANLAQDVAWSAFQIYWGDERCVPPDHPESNYGMAFKHLFQKINFPNDNIHRIRGENNPLREAIRYSNLIQSSITNTIDQIPRFDWLILGIGQDGHTASLFPGQEEDGLCITARHPVSGQYRISMNYELINSAKRITFVVSGAEKAEIVSTVLSGRSASKDLPAARILPKQGILEWFIDRGAACRL